MAGTTTYKISSVFPDVVGTDLDLIVRYQSANVSNTNQAYQDNVAVMKAMVAKYPEVRDAFAAVVARAVDATGRDYGTLLAMKDIR
jgi:predicted solute-binding protein